MPRRRLLRQKWYAALVMSVGAFLTLVVVSVVAGGLVLRLRRRHDAGRAVDRAGRRPSCAWPAWSATSTVHLLVVGALAFWLSTITDAPLAAVGGAVFTMIVFAILEQVTQLGSIRDYFPSAYGDRLDRPAADAGRLRRPVPRRHPVADLHRVLTGLGFVHFARRDVTS